MENKKNIVVLAPGGWGTAMAVSADSSGHRVVMWSKFPREIENLEKTRENPLLKGVKIPDSIGLTTSLESLRSADICIIAVPSRFVGETAELIGGILPQEAIVVSISKGFDQDSCERLSEIISRKLPDNKVVVLTGPSHAEEVARFIPTALVSASRDEQAAVEVREVLSTEALRIYSCPDIIGAELGGAVKNVIALAAGISDGMGLGDNTKAALMTRGLRELSMLGAAMGAKRETFTGLSGMGDLVVTCTSPHSRNRRAGMLIGSGVQVDEAIKTVGTVEGYLACNIVHKLAQSYDVEMPICDSCWAICYDGRDPSRVIYDLMTRPSRHEEEFGWWE